MRRPYLPFPADETGLSAVEFALVLPLLAMLLCGVIEYGWVMKTRLALHHAVSEGARAAVCFSTPTEREAAARAQITAALAGLTHAGLAAGLDSCVTVSELAAAANLPDRFSLSVHDWPYTPLIGFIPTPSCLSADAVMALPE